MDYFSRPGLSFHQLKDFATVSPQYYYRRHVTGEIPGPDSASMRLGRLIHMAALEPEKFGKVPTIPAEHLTPSGGLSTKAATKEWLAGLTVREYGTPEELALCRRLAHAVHANPHAAAILGGAQVEVEKFTTRDGVAIKAKADIVCTESGVWDLKSVATLDNIAAQCRDFNYAEQVLWYNRIFGLTGGGLIVVEKDEPHRVAVIEFDRRVIEAAAMKVTLWWSRFLRCRETGIWPNDPPEVITITLADLSAA